jgi:hypothetical protein
MPKGEGTVEYPPPLRLQGLRRAFFKFKDLSLCSARLFSATSAHASVNALLTSCVRKR